MLYFFDRGYCRLIPYLRNCITKLFLLNENNGVNDIQDCKDISHFKTFFIYIGQVLVVLFKNLYL